MTDEPQTGGGIVRKSGLYYLDRTCHFPPPSGPQSRGGETINITTKINVPHFDIDTIAEQIKKDMRRLRFR